MTQSARETCKMSVRPAGGYGTAIMSIKEHYYLQEYPYPQAAVALSSTQISKLTIWKELASHL